MEIKMRRSLMILAVIGAFLLGVCLTGSVLLIGGGAGGSDPIDSGDDKFTVLKNYVDQMYLNDADENDMAEGAYKGYIDGLGDPYSQYMDADEYSSFLASATGSYEGVGITFSEDENGNYVALEISRGSPAEEAGIKAGDLLLTVDGETYHDINIMASKIRGEAGTSVTLEYSHNGKVKKATMLRKDIVQQSVEYKMLEEDIGYIKIGSFIESTAKDFDKALAAVEKQKAEKLILDLRDNGGGLVDQCVDVADAFLDEGVVCYTEDKRGKTNSYNAEDGKTDMETVVLLNGNSASASEILAGALQDNGFEIVGEKSFGKGVIQTTVELEDGSALKLTIMQYLSPDKHVIQEKGISPDCRVKDKESTKADEQLDKAIDIIK